MFRLLKLGLLAGAGYYAYKKVSEQRARTPSSDPWGNAQHQSDNGLLGQLKRTANQAFNTARQSSGRFGFGANDGEQAMAGEEVGATGQPREAQAARMAAQPAPPPRGEFGAPVTG